MNNISAFIVFCLLSTIPISAISADNPHYIQYPEPEMIRHDIWELPVEYQNHYSKFITYITPDGGSILIVANRLITDEQLLRAYNILGFYLTDFPGSEYGFDKTSIANAMAANGAVLVMPDGADGESNTPEDALYGQPLYQLEFPVEGSLSYITNDFDERDAGFEEIFHMVHDMGIGTRIFTNDVCQQFQQKITFAMQNSLNNNLWGRGAADWVEELRAEGSLEQEYIASVIDSYYGLWGMWNEGDGGMWGVYAAKNREEIARLDPLGDAVLCKFLPSMISYMARIDPDFSGTFTMRYDEDKPYTHKSQYLLNARLLGTLPSGIDGNSHDNIFMGNTAPNTINGREGVDVVQYTKAFEEYTIIQEEQKIIVIDKSNPFDVDELIDVEILRFTDIDVSVSNLPQQTLF